EDRARERRRDHLGLKPARAQQHHAHREHVRALGAIGAEGAGEAARPRVQPVASLERAVCRLRLEPVGLRTPSALLSDRCPRYSSPCPIADRGAGSLPRDASGVPPPLRLALNTIESNGGRGGSQGTFVNAGADERPKAFRGSTVQKNRVGREAY